MSPYAFEVSGVDVAVALECEADRAEREGFTGVAQRQRAVALHLRNAEHHMEKISPEGHRVKIELVVSHVPAVNAVLKAEFRR